MADPAQSLRARAEAETATLPPLLAQADRLAQTVMMGEHGRRRAGPGDDFWQYRPVQVGDSRSAIDWRRSARSDAQFVRQREWKLAQSVMLWVDPAASMRFASQPGLPEKADRARLVALAVTLLLERGGERVGMTGTALPPRRGAAQITRIAQALLTESPADFAAPDMAGLVPQGRALLVSDFLGDPEPVRDALTAAADRGVRGVLWQVLDPAEEAFPYPGAPSSRAWAAPSRTRRSRPPICATAISSGSRRARTRSRRWRRRRAGTTAVTTPTRARRPRSCGCTAPSAGKGEAHEPRGPRLCHALAVVGAAGAAGPVVPAARGPSRPRAAALPGGGAAAGAARR